MTVFDGYTSSSTKDACHRKRCPIVSPELLHVTGSTKLDIKKTTFLANPKNKQWFVEYLADKLPHPSMVSKADADVDIVQAAIN